MRFKMAFVVVAYLRRRSSRLLFNCNELSYQKVCQVRHGLKQWTFVNPIHRGTLAITCLSTTIESGTKGNKNVGIYNSMVWCAI